MRQTEFIQLPLHMRRQYLHHVFIPRPIAGQGKCVQCAHEVGRSVAAQFFCVLHGDLIEKPVHREVDGRRAEAHLENWVPAHLAALRGVSGLRIASAASGMTCGLGRLCGPSEVRAELGAGNTGESFDGDGVTRRDVAVALPVLKRLV